MTSIGEALVAHLTARGVDCVFGIPGVHTIELYRGLAASSIRHVTPRHEQGAGFMADGYARTSGKPGVAFVITGPGLTNTLTAMGQARADSGPMLVVSGVNATDSLGKGLGHAHQGVVDRAVAVRVVLLEHLTDHARALLQEILKNDPEIMNDPPPAVTFEGFGDSTLNMVVRAYLPNLDNRLETIHRLHTTIHARFAREGLEIAFPQRDIHVRSLSMPSELQPRTDPYSDSPEDRDVA